MALTLVVEDGTGLANANSYATAAEADAYFEGHVYNSTWLDKATGEKEQALVHATRMLDANIQWNGTKATDTQALQWPRQDVFDPDDVNGGPLASDEVPQWLKDATCELAQLIWEGNRNVEPDGQGITEFVLTGVLEVTFNAATAKKPLPEWLTPLVTKYGRIIAAAASVKLTRV